MSLKTIEWDHKPITKPGMYAGIPIDLYHDQRICAGPSISSSGLRKIFNESPAHFFAEWSGNPDVEPRNEARHFSFGRATHHLHLGQKDFSKLFVVEPTEYETEDGEIKPWNNNAKACKAWHELRADEERTVIKPADAKHIIRMAKELDRHPVVAHGALNGLVERSLFWKDEKTGIWLKSRPDAIPTASGDFVDYKTTTSVLWVDLIRAIFDYGYNQQGALIRQAAREVLGIDKDFSFALVFQEKKPPYCVSVVTLKDVELDRGDKQNRLALDEFAKCLKTNRWPGPDRDRGDAQPIEMSEFAQKAIDAKITILGGRP